MLKWFAIFQFDIDLADLAIKKKKPRASFDDGHQALVLAEAAAKSLKLKKIIRI